MGSSVGIYFINRPEWLIVDHACSSYSYVSVPLYDTLGKYLVGSAYYFHFTIRGVF
jgi:long-chain acyl-CoA synthetase